MDAPLPSDPETARCVMRARDLLTAGALWAYLVEMHKADVDVTERTIHDVAQGLRDGTLSVTGHVSGTFLT